MCEGSHLRLISGNYGGRGNLRGNRAGWRRSPPTGQRAGEWNVKALSNRWRKQVNKSSFNCYTHKLILLTRNHINIKENGRMDASSLFWCLNGSLFGMLNTIINKNPIMMSRETTLLSSLSSSHPSPLSIECNSKSGMLICRSVPLILLRPPRPRGKH